MAMLGPNNKSKLADISSSTKPQEKEEFESVSPLSDINSPTAQSICWRPT